jgi:hypothetical protein
MKFGANTFEVDGDYTLDPPLEKLLMLWLQAQGLDGSPEAIAALTARLKAANDAEAATVQANTPTP